MSEIFILCYLKYKRPLEAERSAASVQSGFRCSLEETQPSVPGAAPAPPETAIIGAAFSHDFIVWAFESV